jgi:transcriptional regulator with XRE-family HTH domain
MKYTNAGKVIRSLRELRMWSQEQLADIAELSARTVQRVEADQECSKETLNRLAKAFGIEPHELLLTIVSLDASTDDGPAASPHDEESVVLERITEGKALLNICRGAHAYLPHHDDLKTEEEAELVGAFLQNVQDYGDIYGDLDISHVVKASVQFTKDIEDLDEAGFWVFGSRVRRAKKINAQQTTWEVAVTLVIRTDNPKISRSTKKLTVLLPPEEEISLTF